MTQARTTDPDTSWANVSQEKADRATVIAWGTFKAAQRGLTDEELHRLATEAGETINDGRLRHGRLALARLGMIVDTGERRRTSNGGTGRVWCVAPEGQR